MAIDKLQKQTNVNIQEKANLIWEIATHLYGEYKPHEYGKVILEVKLSNGDEIVTTFSIYLNVEKSIDSTDSSDADDDPNLEDIHHTHNNKEVLDQITQEMIDTIVSDGGFVDLTDYQTKEDINLTTIDKTIVGSINELNEKIDNVNIDNIDLSNYVTKTELDEKIANIDLSSLATIEYVDNQINTHNHPTVANEGIEKIMKDIF